MSKLKLLILIACIGQLFFTWKGVECTPFVHWGMYSEPYQRRAQIPELHLIVNDSLIDLSVQSDFRVERMMVPLEAYLVRLNADWADPTKELLSRYEHKMPRAFAQSLNRNLINTTSDIDAFPIWYRVQVEKLLGVSVKKLVVKRAYYVYDPSGQPTLQSSQYFELF